MINKIFSIALFALFVSTGLFAQDTNTLKDTANPKLPVADTLPYLKYPTLPAFNILLIDSTTIFNTYNIPKGQPVALMFFDPDCKHCKATIKQLIENIDSISNIQFYLFSARHDMEMIQEFYKKYKLSNYPFIKAVGMDTEFFFFSYYKVKFVPDIALYDQNRKLLKLFEGSVKIKDLYQLTH